VNISSAEQDEGDHHGKLDRHYDVVNASRYYRAMTSALPISAVNRSAIAGQDETPHPLRAGIRHQAYDQADAAEQPVRRNGDVVAD
jgi:hypothetical protein